MTRNAEQAAIAAHRFGLGEAGLNGPGDDAAGWLLAQIGPAEAQRGTGLVSGVEGLKRFAEFQARQRALPMSAAPMSNAAAGVYTVKIMNGSGAELGAKRVLIAR